MQVKVFVIQSSNAQVLELFLNIRQAGTRFDIFHKANCDWLF